MNQGLVWNLVFAQLVNKFPVFSRIISSLPSSQQPTDVSHTMPNKRGTVTGRWYGRLKNRGSVSGMGYETQFLFYSVQMGSGKQAASYFGSEDAGVKLTSRLHLVPRLRMSGSILPFPTRFHSFHKDKFTHISMYIICIQIKHNFNFQN